MNVFSCRLLKSLRMGLFRCWSGIFSGKDKKEASSRSLSFFVVMLYDRYNLIKMNALNVSYDTSSFGQVVSIFFLMSGCVI